MTGSVTCDAGERVRITVTPISGTPNALGRTSFACSGGPQSFDVTVRMKGDGTKFSDMHETQMFVAATTGDGVDSGTFDVTW